MKTFLKNTAAALVVASATLAPTIASACAEIGDGYIYNGCSYRIFGNYKDSDGGWGGFGPISPGKRESVTRTSGYREISYCDYADWVAGTCRPKSHLNGW